MAGQRPLGDLLVDAGVLTKQQLDDALLRQTLEGERRIASEMLGLGLGHERELTTALARAAGHPALVFSASTLELAALRLVPEAVAEQHLLLPVAMDDETVTVAVADVSSRPVFREVSFATGRRVTLLLAVEQLLREAIPDAYAVARSGQPLLRGALSAHERPHLEVARPVAKRGDDRELLAALVEAEAHRAATPLEHLSAAAPDEGRFSLEEMPVPVMPAPASRPSPEWEEPSSSAAPRALIVEDDHAILKLLSAALRRDGYEILEASSGDAAVALLRGGPPDLVILDAMLPGMHGFDICSRLKGAERYRHVPVLMVSAVYRGWEVAREVQESFGADAFVEKPFDVHYVRKLAAELTGRALSRVPVEPDRASAIKELRASLEEHRTLGEWRAALEHVKRWLALDPFDPLAHLERGNMLSQQRDLEGALRSYEAAVVYDGRLFPALTNLALVYERLGFARKAKESWRRALDAAPDDDARDRITARLSRQ